MSRTDFGAHSYWRVFGSEDGLKSTFVAYSAMAFKDSSGSSIPATGGTAIESGHFSTFAVANLFDGTDATFWESNNTDVPWAGYHFSSPVAVMQIGLQKHASMDGSVPATFALFEFSDDGLFWTTVSASVPKASITTNDTMVWFNFAGAL